MQIELEPNSNASTASNTQLSVATTGTLGNSDTDYFKVNIGSGGLLTLDFTHPQGAGTTYDGIGIMIADTSGNVVAYHTASGNLSYSTTVAAAGDYYIRVTDSDTYKYGSEGIYSFTPTLVTESNTRYDGGANNTAVSAIPVTAGQDAIGSLENADTDFYKINLNDGGLLTLDFTHPQGAGTMGDGVGIKIADASGNVVASHTAGGNLSFNTTVAAAGDYYISVTDSNTYKYGSEGIYSVTSTLVTASNTRYDGGANNTTASAILVTEGQGVIGSLENSDTDYYKVRLNTGDLLKLDFMHPQGAGSTGDGIGIKITNASGNVVANYTAGGNLGFTTTVAEPGDYYIRIADNSTYNHGSEGIYSFTINASETNQVPTGTVTITGTAVQNQTLTASNSLNDADGLGTISYQWQADGSAIPGATGDTLALGQYLVGKTITVIANYIDGHGTEESVTSAVTAEVVSTGNQGNDTLVATNGTETLRGGPGGDMYIVLAGTNQVIELPGEGNDTVQSTSSWILGLNLENLTLTGVGHRSGTGNNLDNVITGNVGNNILDGGVGADTLAGGLGDDTYVVDNIGDVIQESAGAGNDTVISSVNWTLGANQENLLLTGTRNLDGHGNDLDNHLTGNGGGNVLIGGDGADVLNGASGIDLLTGGEGNDTFAFTTPLNALHNVDTLTDFTSGADKIALSSAIFTEMGFISAPASDAFFHAGATAQNPEDRILYDQSTGALSYDLDGSGALAAVQFAVLSWAPVLLYTDFQVG